MSHAVCPAIREGVVKLHGWCHWTSTNFCSFDCSQKKKRMVRERPMTEMSLQGLLMSAFPRGPCQSHPPSATPVDVIWHNWQSQRRKWQDPSEDGDWIHTSSHPIKGNFSRSSFRWIKGIAFGRGPSAHPSAGHPSSCHSLCAGGTQTHTHTHTPHTPPNTHAPPPHPPHTCAPHALISASESFQAAWYVWVHIVFVKRCSHDLQEGGWTHWLCSTPTPCTHTLVLYNFSTMVGIAAMIRVPDTGTKIEIVGKEWTNSFRNNRVLPVCCAPWDN